MIATNDHKDAIGTRKMTIAKANTDPIFEVFAQMFAACPSAVAQVRTVIGDAQMTDFWFDYALGHHAVYYKYRQDGVIHTAFARLEK